MRTLAILFAIIAVSSAATIMTMDDKDFEKAMMEHMASQGNLNPMMGILALMDAQEEHQQGPEAVEAEGGEGEEVEAEEPADDQKEGAAVEAEEPHPYLNMIGNGMTAFGSPDTMTGAIPYAAKQPNKKKPAGISNNKKHELSNGNGNRRGGSAAAASASSFSSGPKSFSSSQAQAFSRGSK